MIHKARALIREVGPGDAAVYALDRFGEAALAGRVRAKRIVLVSHDVAAHTAAKARRRQFEIRRFKTGEAIAAGVPVDPERAERRHANDAWCIAAFADEALVGYRWLQLGSHRDEELRVTFVLEPPDQVAWLWNFYVDPHYRATRLFSYLWEETFALLRDLGAARTLSWIWAIQPGLVNAERRFGATIVGTASFFVLGRWQLMLSTLSPRAHVSLGPKQEPRLVVGDATQNVR